MPCSNALVILDEVFGIATCGTRTSTEVTACIQMPDLLTTKPLRTSIQLHHAKRWMCYLQHLPPLSHHTVAAQPQLVANHEPLPQKRQYSPVK